MPPHTFEMRTLTDEDSMTKFNRPLLLLPFLALFAVAGCETAEGFGRDVGTAGDAIAQEAREAQ